MNNLSPSLITTKEASNLLKVTRQTLYKLIEDRKIKGKKIGRSYRFYEDDILSYIGNNKNQIIGLQESEDSVVKKWLLKDNFAAVGIKKMAKRTFQHFASNMCELIVNAYDEDATEINLTLNLNENTLSIIDNGNGMDENDLIKYVIYGESNKTSNYKSPNFHRSPIGEYGMGGKLAITNLCKNCKVITKKAGQEHIFNMDKSHLDRAKYITDIKRIVTTKKCNKDLHGTNIFMANLLYKGINDERFMEKIAEKMPISQNFRIFVTVIKDEEKKKHEIKEPLFEAEKEFKFERELKLIGFVSLKISYTKEALPATKQGIWTKVNGRIVNEKQEWFDLLNLTSGWRYKWRIYGIGIADGLKDYITFSKNDFMECPEYQEYYKFVQESLYEVQTSLLKMDMDIKRKKQRECVKKIAEEINKTVAELDKPEIIKEVMKSIKREATKKIEKKVTDNKDIDVEQTIKELQDSMDKNRERRKRRKRNLVKGNKISYENKSYIIETVDMSTTGDLVRFTREQSLLEINEKHPFYVRAGRENYLEHLVRDLAHMEIARDYSDGNDLIFDDIFNKLSRLSLKIFQK